MARYVSFALLLVVIVFLGIVFFRVMSGFFVPLFLAALFVVIFSPINDWFIGRLKDVQALQVKRRAEKVGALITTLLISILILVPTFVMLGLAFNEARLMLGSTSTTQVVDKIKSLRTSMNLDLPAANVIHAIEKQFDVLRATMKPEELKNHRQLLFEMQDEALAIAREYKLEVPTKEELAEWNQQLAAVPKEKLESPNDGTAEPEPEIAPLGRNEKINALPPFAAYFAQLSFVAKQNELITQQSEPADFYRYQLETLDLEAAFRRLKYAELLGSNAWLKELANPSEEKLVEYGNTSFQVIRDQLLKFGSASTSFLTSLLLGIAIMLFAFYFFLLDGSAMIESLKGLSPLDDGHEQELVNEFSVLSRAVVLATLLSALAQGALASIGYYFAGLESIFLLTMLTTCLAMVPFVGAAAVWVPSCIYLYLIDGSLGAAIGLAIYGSAVISMVDNFIKPAVLHGQSNLHPLLAFLSIVGGVSALGPIGILIGPMIVAFLQTLLEIFQREVRSLDEDTNKLHVTDPDDANPTREQPLPENGSESPLKGEGAG